jgi:S-adenosylmethionine:tRNA ribosyltransferase-isomerase
MNPGKPNGEPRDAARMLVIDPALGALQASAILALPEHLRAGDLLVLNDAATLPASLRARSERGEPLELRLLAPAYGELRAVLFGAGDYRTRTEERPPPPVLEPGEAIELSAQLSARVLRRSPLSARLIELRFDRSGAALWSELYALGKPVQYAYHDEALPLWSVQTMYASRPWAAEMPSAGRPLSFATLLALKRRGVRLASLTHAAGLSSTGDPALDRALPLPERYDIPLTTARVIARTRAEGGRVIAVGTTVVRALESAALSGGGLPQAGEAVTELKLEPSFRRQIVSGILSGIHAPEESHYALLGCFVDPLTLGRGHALARELGLRDHEFGDASLILAGSLSDDRARAA